jgi:hypothetical protein
MVVHHLVMHLSRAMHHPCLMGLMRLVVLVLDDFCRHRRGLIRPSLRRRERDKRSDGGDDQASFATENILHDLAPRRIGRGDRKISIRLKMPAEVPFEPFGKYTFCYGCLPPAQHANDHAGQ